MSSAALLDWLRETCTTYVLEPVAIYRRSAGTEWPLVAHTETELEAVLRKSGRFLALPSEPAALANLVEISVVDFLLERIRALPGAEANRGSERGYPDLEIRCPLFGESYHAIDIKVARRNASGLRTQSAITLYTGNTYFKHPTVHWPGTPRPFGEYESHLDVIGIYTLNKDSLSRMDDFELIVQEPWRIASRQRSSTTREYIGAVTSLEDLRAGRGVFETEAEFYSFWRSYPFRTSRQVERTLASLLAAARGGGETE